MSATDLAHDDNDDDDNDDDDDDDDDDGDDVQTFQHHKSYTMDSLNRGFRIEAASLI